MALSGFGSLGSLVVRIETDLTNFNAGLRSAEQNLQRTRGNLLKATQAIGKAFTVMGVATTASLVGFAKTAIDFEDAFTGVRKTVDATEEEFKQLSTSIRKMSTEMPVAANELAGIGEIAGQLGIRGVKNLEKFIDVIAKTAVATKLTSEAAATSFARIANVMNEPIANVDRMGSSIVKLGNTFAANEIEISDFANRIAGAGRIAKLATHDIFAISAAFTSVGIQAEAGGTSVQKVLNAITQAVAEGNEDLVVFAETVGLTVDEFVALQRADPAKAFALFVQGLGQAGDAAFGILQRLGLQNERVIRSFLNMAKSSDLLIKALDTSKQAWQDNIALEEEAAQKFRNATSQLKILLNKVVEVGRKIGDTLLPTIQQIIKDITPLINKIQNWIEINPELTVTITKIVGVLGLLAGVVGPILIVLPHLIAGIKAAGLAFGALGATASPVIGWLAIIGLAIWQLKILWDKNFLGIKTTTITVIDAIKVKFLEFRVAIQEFANGFKEDIKNGLNVFEIWNKAWDTAKVRVEGMMEIEAAYQEMQNQNKEQVVVNNEEKAASDEAYTDKVVENTQKVLDSKKRAASEINKIDTDTEKVQAKLMKQQEVRQFQHVQFEGSLLQMKLQQLAGFLGQAGEENSGAARASKALSSGLAIIDTALGITKALATYPWPYSLVVAGIVGAAGAAQIATINGVGFAEGTDSVPAMLTPGEMIFPQSMADAIRSGDIVVSGRDGGAGGSTIGNININVEAVIANDLDINNLTQLLGENIERELRRVG